MRKAPSVIHQYGRPMLAKDVTGHIIHREDKIFVPAYGEWFNTLDYDNHFVYLSRQIGSALMCTCGSSAAAVGYQEYKKYCSYKGQRVIACLAHLNDGKHADGST